MPRLKPAVTINIHFHDTGERHKLELCRLLFDRWRVRYNRINSAVAGDLTLSEFCRRLRKLLLNNI